MLLPTTTAVANVANLPNALTISKSSRFPPVQGSFGAADFIGHCTTKRLHQNRCELAEVPYRKPKLAWRLQSNDRQSARTKSLSRAFLNILTPSGKPRPFWFLSGEFRTPIDPDGRMFPDGRWSGFSLGPARKSKTAAGLGWHRCRREGPSIQRSRAPKQNRRPAAPHCPEPY